MLRCAQQDRLLMAGIRLHRYPTDPDPDHGRNHDPNHGLAFMSVQNCTSFVAQMMIGDTVDGAMTVLY